MNKLFPEPESEFDAGNNKKYKVEAIKDRVVYSKEAKKHLPDLYYLVFLEKTTQKKTTWELFSIVM